MAGRHFDKIKSSLNCYSVSCPQEACDIAGLFLSTCCESFLTFYYCICAILVLVSVIFSTIQDVL